MSDCTPSSNVEFHPLPFVELIQALDANAAAALRDGMPYTHAVYRTAKMEIARLLRGQGACESSDDGRHECKECDTKWGAPLADDDGPGEEDGPWADGWNERASPEPKAPPEPWWGELMHAVGKVVKAAEVDPYLTAELSNAISNLNDHYEDRPSMPPAAPSQMTHEWLRARGYPSSPPRATVPPTDALRTARLEWALLCNCNCPACKRLHDRLQAMCGDAPTKEARRERNRDRYADLGVLPTERPDETGASHD